MKFKPFGEWITVSVDTDAAKEYDADGRLVMDYNALIPNAAFAQGRIADIGDIAYADHRLAVGDHVVYFSESVYPTFVEEGGTFRMIQIGDVIAINREPNKEQS